MQPRHIFKRVKAFIFMLVPGGLQFLIISKCFVLGPVTSISKSHVLTARARVIFAVTNHSLLLNRGSLPILLDVGNRNMDI